MINQTNSQTRKLFCEVINSSNASVIVQADGKITFFNETFRSLLTDRLQVYALPANILGLLEDGSYDQT